MKRDKDKEFDDLFKNQLKDAEASPAYLEDDWANLELMLDQPRKKRGIVFWLPLLSSAAAILIFLGWWLFRPDVAPMVKPRQQVAVNVPQKTGHAAGKSQNNGAAETQTIEPAQLAAVKQSADAQNGVTSPGLVANNVNNGSASAGLGGNNAQKANKVKSLSFVAATQNQGAGQNKFVRQNPAQQNFDNGTSAANVANAARVAANREHAELFTADALLTLNADSKNVLAANVNAKSRVDKIVAYPETGDEKARAKSGSSVFVKRPLFALTVLGAPEVNGVGSFSDAKSGTNIGLLFSAGIFNKITVSTGANYAVMPYNTNIANYHTSYYFRTSPSQIEANCRALDIPVNVDYQLFNKRQNKFSIGTGLSSYIMLHENYQYYYTDPNAKGPTNYTVPTHGKYMFGIANIQATYTRQVNSKFGVSIQPYLKLPLTNIGYSQAKLQTAGVAVGLSWNINALTKP